MPGVSIDPPDHPIISASPMADAYQAAVDLAGSLPLVSGIVGSFVYETTGIALAGQSNLSGLDEDEHTLYPGESYTSVAHKLNNRLKEVEKELSDLKSFVAKELHQIKMQMRWDDITEGTNEQSIADREQHPDVHGDKPST